MRGKIALALVALAAGIAACGDTESTEPLAAIGPPTRTAPARSPRTNPNKECAPQGLEATRLYEGSCRQEDTKFVVVNRGSRPLRLESLIASIDGITVMREVGRGAQAVQPREGAFVRVALTVRNRREFPQNFEVGQTIFGVGEETFREAAAAERAHAEALSAQDGGRIEPEGTLRGDVLFDVPPAVIPQISTAGRFFVANFGERPGEIKPLTREQREQEQIAAAIGGSIGPDPQQLGQVRLYAAPAPDAQ